MSENSFKNKTGYRQIQEVSPTFCLAKWLQVTIDLLHGTNHSCHHPIRHDISISEISKNPSALHNTKFKKQQRKLMLEGNRPKECSYCWKIEDTPGEHVSDRMIKSLDDWSFPHLKKVLEKTWDEDINPTYLEVMFGNECNFSCAYCMADISTTIEKEIQKYGMYDVFDPYHRSHRARKKTLPNNNPYLKSFWKWFPSLIKELHVFRITGGEPLLNKNTFKVLQYLKDNPSPNLILAVNTNLGISRTVIEDFFNKVSILTQTKKIQRFELYVSVDTDGKQAEYLRPGLKIQEFWKMIDLYTTINPNSLITIMVTFNILSIANFLNLLRKVKALKESHTHVLLDISHLRHPTYLSIRLCPQKFKENFIQCIKFMQTYQSTSTNGFTMYEINKFVRIYHLLQSSSLSSFKMQQNKRDFYSFINEFDRRMKTKFELIFPEYLDFYYECSKVFQKLSLKKLIKSSQKIKDNQK